MADEKHWELMDEAACKCPAMGPNGESCMPRLMEGHEPFDLYTEGDHLYRAMLESIAEARRSVRFESYIFAADETGWRFAEALAGKARAGVRVRLHIDAAGSLWRGSRGLVGFMRGHGVEVRRFHRWSWRMPARYNRRNHRKLLVVDERRMFMGGFNIHRENSRALVGDRRWRDLHIGLSGPVAGQAASLFDDFWQGQRHWLPPRVAMVNALIPNHTRACNQAIHCMYAGCIGQARQTVYLATPYFIPDSETRQALSEAARRGVDVRLLVPRKSDVRLARWAAQAAYANLLLAGVRIFEYLPRMLHAKVAVADGVWATLGTANLDYRSFFTNYELNLLSRDPGLCHSLREQLLQDMQDTEEITVGRWGQRPWVQYPVESLAWLLRRWL